MGANTQVVTLAVTFETEECCDCGMPFAMTADFRKRRLEKRDLFYCPAGHPQHYLGKSEAQQLRERLDATLKRENEERAARVAAEKANERLKRRVKAGTCPCCKRTVSQLARHMKSKHPEYAK